MLFPDPCATEIATITYRSGPEWDQRFGRQLRPVNSPSDVALKGGRRVPALCPDFLIETYLDHQVRIAWNKDQIAVITVVTGRTILSQIRCELLDLYF